jgi:hypothetical protein
MANDIVVDIKINGLSQGSAGVKQLTDALNGLSKPAQKTQDNIKGLEKSMANLASKGFKNLVTTAIAAGAAIVSALGFRASIRAAIEQENAVNKLNFALKASGQFSNQTSAELQALASELQKTTRFGDDLTLSVIGQFSAINRLNKDGLVKATTASADLAAVLGVDLKSAGDLVSKAIEGNTGALGRYGIQIKKGSTDAEQLSNVLQALARFQGQAANEAKTFGGALAIANNAFGDLGEEIGNLVIKNPVVIKIIRDIGELFAKVGETIKENQGLIIESFNQLIVGTGKLVQALNPVFNFIILSFNNLIGIIRLSIQGFIELFSALSGFQTASNLIKSFIAALLEIPKGLILLISTIQTLWAESSLVSSAFKKAGIDIGKFGPALDEQAKKLEDFQLKLGDLNISESFSGGLESIDGVLAKTQEVALAQNDLAKSIGKDIENLGKVGAEATKKAKDPEEEAVVRSKTFFEKLGGIFTNFGGFLEDAKTNLTAIDKNTGLSRLRTDIEALGPQLLASVTQGAQGAIKSVGAIAGKIGDAIIPGLGSALQPFIEMFAMGPEQTRQMVSAFIDAAAQIPINIIDSIPVFFETIIRKIPDLINGIARLFYERIGSIPFWLSVAKTVAQAFIQSIPEIVKGLIDQIKKSLTGGLFGGSSGGGFLGGIVGSVGKLFNFAKGGMVVKGGTPGADSVPSLLTPGELVIDRTTTSKLMDYLNRQSSPQNNDVTNALLVKVISLLESPISVSTSVELQQKTLADIIVNLNRVNARLA